MLPVTSYRLPDTGFSKPKSTLQFRVRLSVLLSDLTPCIRGKKQSIASDEKNKTANPE